MIDYKKTDFNINSHPSTWTTKDGRGVTIYTKDGPARSPIHGLIEGATSPIAWTKDGLAVDHTGCTQDGWCDAANLLSPRKTVKVDFWVNVYPTGASHVTRPTRKAADEAPCASRIACKHIVMEVDEEGEFDKESIG